MIKMNLAAFISCWVFMVTIYGCIKGIGEKGSGEVFTVWSAVIVIVFVLAIFLLGRFSKFEIEE